MDKLMVVIIFCVGLVLIGVSITALFKHIIQGGAALEWKSFKVSGTGAVPIKNSICRRIADRRMKQELVLKTQVSLCL